MGFCKKRIIENTEKTPETLRFSGVFLVPYYTIPKIKRELKLRSSRYSMYRYYTIPKIKRELKPGFSVRKTYCYYTIPKIKRELKLRGAKTDKSEIIPYQKLKGN